MNIEEISNSLPNGFHDAKLHTINIDYAKREAIFTLKVEISSPEDVNAGELYRHGVLKLSSFLYCVIESPDVSVERDNLWEQDGLWITSDSSDFGELKSYPKLPEPLPEHAFRHWFFIDN